MVKPKDHINADCVETSYVFKAAFESFHYDNIFFLTQENNDESSQLQQQKIE